MRRADGSRRQRRQILVGALIAIVGALLLAVSPADAAPRPPTTCGWDGQRLWAENLPDAWSMTWELYPIGVTPRPPSFSVVWEGEPRTAYFWTRKGPGSNDYPKPGRQLQDYKIACMAVP